MLNIEFSNNSKRFLKNANKELYGGVMERIGNLKKEPIPSDSKIVKGFKGKVYRVRVGSYRILYEIYKEQSKLLIVKIDKRESVYN